MELFDTYVGRTTDEAVAERLASSEVATVRVDDEQRRRSRFRTTSDAGTDVGVVVGRTLRAGDVLSTGDPDGPLLRVALTPIEALVVDLSAAVDDLTAAVALGHAAGNRHWKMAIEDERVLFPVSESVDRMRTVLDAYCPAGVTIGRETVSPGLFDDEGNAAIDHSHRHDHGHDHGASENTAGHSQRHGNRHEHDHRQEHDHSDGHEHDVGRDHASMGPVHDDGSDHAARGHDHGETNSDRESRSLGDVDEGTDDCGSEDR